MKILYHVLDKRTNIHVFVSIAPKLHGCEYSIDADVCLSEQERLTEWPNGAKALELCLGQNRQYKKEYRAFRSDTECKKEGYHINRNSKWRVGHP